MTGFETVPGGLVRSDWKDRLSADLERDFAGIVRQPYRSGRVEHFSYLPAGSTERVFVRRLARGGFLSFLGNLHWGFSRPHREIRATEAALRAGVPVPEILAVQARRLAGPLFSLSIVMKEIHGAEPLLDANLPPAEKRRVIEKVADTLRRMCEAGIYHIDLTVRNILLDDARNVHIIDLDQAELTSRDPGRDVRLISRLNRSVEKTMGRAVTRTDKIRFLRRFSREGVRELAERCASGLWFHRLWWSLSGQA